jgi:hypothetical protein
LSDLELLADLELLTQPLDEIARRAALDLSRQICGIVKPLLRR